MDDEARVVVDGKTQRAWWWLLSRLLLIAVLGASFAASEADPTPAIYISAGCVSYILAWFVYLYFFAARTRYEFDATHVEAWRGHRRVVRVPIEAIETVSPGWWHEGLSNVFPNVWLWMPRMYLTLKDGSDVAFPSIATVIWDDHVVFDRIHELTGMSFRVMPTYG